MTEAGLQKLPKWAQQEVARLTRELDSANARAKLLVDAQPKSKIWVQLGGLGDDKRYLNEWDQVRFDIGGGQRNEITVMLARNGTAVEVRSSWGQLVVLPHVTNVMHVKSVDN